MELCLVNENTLDRMPRFYYTGDSPGEKKRIPPAGNVIPPTGAALVAYQWFVGSTRDLEGHQRRYSLE